MSHDWPGWDVPPPEPYWGADLLVAVATLIAAAFLLFGVTGCAMHAQLDPPTFTAIAFYGRATTCKKADVPDQLIPQQEPGPPMARGFEPEPPPCRTLEVGAMPWGNMAAALLTALASLLVLL